MNEINHYIQRAFETSIETKRDSLVALEETIGLASALLNQALVGGHKILACGNGGSASDAQHFSSELLNRYDRDRLGAADAARRAKPHGRGDGRTAI